MALSASTNLTLLPMIGGNNGSKLLSASRRLGLRFPAVRVAAGEEATSLAFDLTEYVSAKRTAVERALEKAVPLCRPQRLQESMRYTLLGTGGKRIRPLLVFAACEFVGGKESAVMPFACAVEMLHAVGIILDDLPCMENESLRRGRPTNHVEFGEANAIAAYGSLSSLGLEHAAVAGIAAGLSPETVVKAVAELGAGVNPVEGLTAGMIMDKEYEGKGVDIDTVLYIHWRKTARLLESSSVCGALAGGGSEEEVQKLRRYGKAVGLLFRVSDDILDAGIDVPAGRVNCTMLIGLDGAKKLAGELLAQAEKELAGADEKKAAPLRALARFVAYRDI